jgi:hypothetical protein
MEKVTLTLTVGEVNQIMDILGQQPFVEVYKLIEKIHLQAKDNLEQSK